MPNSCRNTAQQTRRLDRQTLAGALACLLLCACDMQRIDNDVVWAVNIGGPAYTAKDGTEFRPEDSVSGGVADQIDLVKGSQDPALYRTFRVGDIAISHPLKDGFYDLTFHFAEPHEIKHGDRVFDTLIEGKVRIDDLDIMAFRDGKVHSALTVTVPAVELSDGELNIEFEASAGEPVLNAILVRASNQSRRDATLVWSDEFDQGLDESLWNIDVWPARVVNDEDQAYTAEERNLRVEDGHLVIEAHKEELDNASYTSARIHTRGKADILYGRIDVRAKLPSGMGTWPAIWMLPSDPFRYATNCEDGQWQGNADCDAWPNSGEIDIMEHVGYQMGHVHGTVHNEAYYWAKWEQRKGRVLLEDVDTAFHVYSLEWTADRIDVFVDDILYFTYVNEQDGWRSWPYDHPYHLILNVAVGGMWGRAGGGIDDTIFPQRMVVDYVRVFELDQ